MGKKQNKIGVVYSTNPDFEYMYEEEELVETLPASQQTLKIQLDKKQRAGKQVTLINNFIGTQEDLKELVETTPKKVQNLMTEHSRQEQQKEIKRLQSLVDRFKYKPSKASFAMSKLRQIERMVLIMMLKKC